MQIEKVNISKEVKVRLTNHMEDNEFRSNYNNIIGYYYQLIAARVKEKEKLEEFTEVITIALNSQYYSGYSIGLELLEMNKDDIPSEFFKQEIGYYLFEVNNLILGNLEEEAYVKFRTDSTKEMVHNLVIEFENILPVIKEIITHITLEGIRQCFLDKRAEFNVPHVEVSDSVFREQDLHLILPDKIMSCELLEMNFQAWKIYNSINIEEIFGEILFINSTANQVQFVKFYLSQKLTAYQQDLLMEKIYKAFNNKGFDMDKIAFEKYVIL